MKIKHAETCILFGNVGPMDPEGRVGGKLFEVQAKAYIEISFFFLNRWCWYALFYQVQGQLKLLPRTLRAVKQAVLRAAE